MDESRYLGCNFDNLRKALFLLMFGPRDGECNDFSSPYYKYIIPMRGNFENPIKRKNKDTYMMYWIEQDQTLVNDGYSLDEETGEGYNVQKCVASVLVRCIGDNAEDWIKTFRHLSLRDDAMLVWESTCNATKLSYTMPVVPFRTDFSGNNDEVAFDIRFKLYYDEYIATKWKPLTGVDFGIKAEIIVDDDKTEV